MLKVKAVGIGFLLLATACSGIPTTNTDTTNIHLYESVDMSSRMHAMSAELLHIHINTMRSELTANEHQELLTRLRALEGMAKAIGGDGVITNYSVINQYMGAFIYDVQLAQKFANKTPPNYVPANRLVKSCESCHDS